jgi:hypothetical protein
MRLGALFAERREDGAYLRPSRRFCRSLAVVFEELFALAKLILAILFCAGTSTGELLHRS